MRSSNRMISNEDILHKTTYVWKEEKECAIIIKNDGNKIILNPKATKVWKGINDEDSVEELVDMIQIDGELTKEEIIQALESFINVDIITNQDFFWGNDLL